jgi:hypothetical protein
MSIYQGLLPYKLEVADCADPVTAYAGLGIVVEAATATWPRKVWRELRDALGYRSRKVVRRHVLSLVALVAAGGEHISDLATLRGDRGLRIMLGFKPSSPTQAKEFLYRFHQAEDGRLLTDEDDDELSVRGFAQLRAEGPGLRCLDAMVQRVVNAVQAIQPRSRATLDVDASIIAAHKQRALKAYEGTVGYQPQMAYWAEQRIWVCDQFRDGNVPAEFELEAFLQRAFACLPRTVVERRLRGDSALYNEAALSWVDDQDIQFAVSADMSPALEAKVKAIVEGQWQDYPSLNDKAAQSEERQWAEVPDFVPDWKRNHKKDGDPFRYIAIRVRSRQRDLLEPDEDRWRHFAVVTNMDWNGGLLLRWHREKQGTVEYGHGVTKNDLGGGVLPCGRFGANAAWWRINLLLGNLLELLKVQALPGELAVARPKTLRFCLFNLAGRLVYHARYWTLRVYSGLPFAQALGEARRRLVDLAHLLQSGGAVVGT